MATMASTHPVASREEWLKARLELLEAEKAHTRRATSWRSGANSCHG